MIRSMSRIRAAMIVLALAAPLFAQATVLQIVDSEGKPMAGIPVWAEHHRGVNGDDAAGVNGRTDTEGRFTFASELADVREVWIPSSRSRGALHWSSFDDAPLRIADGVGQIRIPRMREVRWHVVDPNGAAVAGVTVEIDPTWFRSIVAMETTPAFRNPGEMLESAADGRVAVGLPVGRYRVTTSHGDLADMWLLVDTGDGPIDATIHVRGSSRDRSDGRDVRVRVVSPFPVNAETSARITPIVPTASRTATEGLVAVVDRSSAPSARVDGNGTAVVRGVLAMPSLVYVTSPGCRPEHVNLSPDVDSITVTLTAASMLTGVVVDDAGRRVPDVAISVDRQRFFHEVATTKTDAAGCFALPIDAERIVTVIAHHPDHGGAVDGPHAVGAKDVAIRIVLSPRGGVDGTLRVRDDEQVANAFVWLHDPHAMRTWKTRSSDGGEFRFDDIPPGEYAIGARTLASAWTGSVHVVGGRRSHASLGVDRAAPGVTIDVVDASTGAKIVGAWWVPDGFDDLRFDDASRHAVRCGIDGRLRCPRPPFGAERIRVVAPGYVVQDVSPITSDSPADPIVVRLQKGVSVSLRLRNSDGGMFQPRTDRLDLSSWPRTWDAFAVDDGHGGMRLLNLSDHRWPSQVHFQTALEAGPFGVVELTDVAPGPLRFFVGSNLRHPRSPRLTFDIDVPAQPTGPIVVRLPW
jgi:hypothetical protein